MTRPGEDEAVEAAQSAADEDGRYWIRRGLLLDADVALLVAAAYPMIAKAVAEDIAAQIEAERQSIEGSDVEALNQRAGLHVAGLIARQHGGAS
jgi:hypothetical protein